MPEPQIKPIQIESVPWVEWADMPRFAVRYRHLSQAALGDDYHVGVAIEELPPGKQTAPFHYHFHEEEHVFVLEGAVTLRLGAHRHSMRQGDYACFPAGQKAGHCLINEGSVTARYVIIGENDPKEVAVYPDSNKVLVRALGRRAIFDMAELRGYWHGEETGLASPPPSDAAVELLDSAPPKPPISSNDADWRDEAEGQGPHFGGRSKHLTGAAVGARYNVGVLIESPAPGKRLCPRHYHMLEEEHALVLEGELTVLLDNDERHVMHPGDYVCFPAGLKNGHSLMNTGTGPASYLMIGEHNPNDVCVYPDSKKVMVRALKSWEDIFDMSATRGYWDGEAG